MLHELKECQYCNEVFHSINGRIFSNHIRWCEKNPNSTRYRKKKCQHCGELYELHAIKHEETCKQNPQNIKYCTECGEQIKHDGIKFCNKSCAATYNNKHKKLGRPGPQKGFEWEKSIKPCKECGKGIETYVNVRNIKCDTCRKGRFILKYAIIKKCEYCGGEYNTNNTSRKYCSKKCISEVRRRKDDSLIAYRLLCAFKFSLSDYPEEFNFSLIEQHGWYKAKNHGDNLNGVSRDHMLSVRYGYDNNIDPKIISHPANCQLMVHNKNSSKCDSCSVTLIELKQKIEKWNEKYNIQECSDSKFKQ